MLGGQLLLCCDLDVLEVSVALREGRGNFCFSRVFGVDRKLVVFPFSNYLWCSLL